MPTERTALEKPFTFDGHGINDARGKRIATLTQPKFMEDGRTPNPEHEQAGRLLASACDLQHALHVLRDAFMIGDENMDEGQIEAMRNAGNALKKAGGRL